MNQLEILKAFLQDKSIMQKYGISQKEIDEITLSTISSNKMITFLKHLVYIVENEKTVNTAASNLNKFLEQNLRTNA